MNYDDFIDENNPGFKRKNMGVAYTNDKYTKTG